MDFVTFTCIKCKEYKSTEDIRIHFNSDNNSYMYVCKECSKGSGFEIETYSCQNCKFIFTDFKGLKDKITQCINCNKPTKYIPANLPHRDNFDNTILVHYPPKGKR